LICVIYGAITGKDRVVEEILTVAERLMKRIKNDNGTLSH